MSIEQLSSALAANGLNPDSVAALIHAAIAEDLAGGVDVTTVATVPADQQSRVELTARQAGVVCGVNVAALVFQIVADESEHALDIQVLTDDGERVTPGTVLLRVTGSTRDLLTAERTALNLICHLSGVATLTAQWADALAGSKTAVRDTRKTTPLLRSLEKYAVRCGGGINHRMSLSDAALVKDNHVVAAGGVANAFKLVRDRFPGIPVEVEVDSLDQLEEVLEAGADLVLLDNFTPSQMTEAVHRTEGRAKLEASGGLTLPDAPALAATGVDYVSIGALTHSAPVLDIGADLSAI